MGLLSNIRKKERIEQKVQEYFKVMNMYMPVFTTFEGSIYEMELTRAAIHNFAQHCSKLKPEIKGDANPQLKKFIYKPNGLMDTKKYLYRLATAYMVENTVLISPLYEADMHTINGFYPMLLSKSRKVTLDGTEYLIYDFGNGQKGAIEFEKTGRMTQYQYKDEYFGETNKCLRPTLELMHVQNQGIIEGVKTSAALRFIAKLAQALKPEDIEEEKKRFIKDNLGAENNGGVLMFDTKYEDVKQIESKPFIVNPSQMSLIQENVYSYFGTNKDILQNNFTPEKWNAYYEGKIEPFAIEAGLVHTNMSYTERQIEEGNEIMFSSNRLQYQSHEAKLNTVTQLFDRGMMTVNQGLEVFNMPSVPDGDKRYIRLEYTEASKIEEKGEKNE